MVIRVFRRYLVLLCCAALAAVIGITMAVNMAAPTRSASSGQSLPQTVSSSDASEPQTSSQEEIQQTSASSEEMRAVWVPYLSLDMSAESDKSEQAFQKKFSAIIEEAKSCNMNTLIVQVRPFGDALYHSSLFPWSHITGGKQGEDPGYDPLKDMTEACHAAGLKIHAWVNPLRIRSSGTPSYLSEDNPYYTFINDPQKSNYISVTDGGIYYNPAYAEVRKLVADGVAEIVKNYDVDGVQFDDYFDPTQDASFDKAAYDEYCASAAENGSALSLAEWRRANISEMVSRVYRAVKAEKANVPFGIAPQGNIQNDLNMGADVSAWCSARGFVDYICPQLYYNFQNPTLPFDRAADTWCALVKNQDIKLYFGLAAYKASSSADSGTWLESSSILASEVQYGRVRKCDGFMFYSIDYLVNDQTKEEIANVVKLLN